MQEKSSEKVEQKGERLKPTAYDAAAVVAQLEKKIQTHEHCIEYEKKKGTITEEFLTDIQFHLMKGDM